MVTPVMDTSKYVAIRPDETAQEVFDSIVNHLRAQGRRSVTHADADAAAGRCLYRGPEGTACAVGCRIPDSEYTPKMETHSVVWLQADPNTEALPSIRATERHTALLSSMQSVHDTTPVEDWEDGFRSVAKNVGLVYTPPTAPRLGGAE